MHHINFNNASGTSDQQYCQNDCVRVDSSTKKIGRRNSDNEEINICYTENEGTVNLSSCLDMCSGCPEFLNFKAQQEA